MDHDDLARNWAPTLGQSAPAPTHDTGIMIALYPPNTYAAELAIEGGEAPGDLHLTLAYLGDVGTEYADSDWARLAQVVQAWAAQVDPFTLWTGGVGVFRNDPPVTYASIDSPVLTSVRQSLIQALTAAGLSHRSEHGFTPHMTLAYQDQRQVDVPRLEWQATWAALEFGEHRRQFAFGAQKPKEATLTVASDQVYRFEADGSGTVLQVSDRPTSQAMETVPTGPTIETDTAKAFVTDVGGKTLITGPATTIAAMKDPTVEDITAAHMLWMHGRFVGAETPNRNGALWSAGDLEMAKGSVVNGPLNWLHDARHVIGTLAKADYVDPRSQKAAEGPTEPHITATAAIWKWIYPDEAYVVQQASDQGMLWYSMECISKEVSCVGAGGCGNTTSYADYMSGAACDHVRQRASVRRFVDPVFLGGAVIVPPTRPGWAEADARVMSDANALAEAAFEQAGRPDVPANDWEQLMSQLVRFATA